MPEHSRSKKQWAENKVAFVHTILEQCYGLSPQTEKIMKLRNRQKLW